MIVQGISLLKSLGLHDKIMEDTPFIFTDSSYRRRRGDTHTERSAALDYWKAAEDSGRPFIPIFIKCRAISNVVRLYTGGRSIEEAQHVGHLRKTCKIYQFACKRELTLDVTVLTAEVAAAWIHAWVRSKRTPFRRCEGVSDYSDSPSGSPR